MWPFRGKKVALSRDESLNSRPVRNEAILVRETDAGELELTIPQRDATWVKLLAKVFFVPPHRKIVLDELGMFVWERCDGETTVKQMIDTFSERFKLSRREAEFSLTSFLRTLAKRKLIGFAVVRGPDRPKGGDGKPGSGKRRKKR